MTPTTYRTRTATHRGTVALQMVNDWIAHGTKIRPCRLVGRGKRTANDDHTARVRAILDALRCKYNAGNDAPRGGLTGQWIMPDRASWRKLAPVREAWQAEEQAKASKAERHEREQAAKLAALYADKPWRETLVQWWKDKAFHPAPEPVLKAKQESGLSWKQVRELCRASC